MRKGAGREVLRYVAICWHRRYGETHLAFLRDWDLWGPLILCLMLGILLSVNVGLSSLPSSPVVHTIFSSAQAPESQALGVFTSVIVIVCVGALVVTIQAKVRMSWRCSPFIQPYSALASRWTRVRFLATPFVSLF